LVHIVNLSTAIVKYPILWAFLQRQI